MPHLILHPPAKLNLFLHIVGRRVDGYHELQTIFELIDWCDELTLRLRDDGQIVRTAGAEVPPEQDLIVRAARALQAFAAPGQGAELALTKSIPTGAGLGGGSSDAAATLLGLDRLWDLRLSRAQLAQIGLSLGADVPVFIGQQPARAEGVGERLLTIPLQPRQYLVVYPGVSLATASMFADPRLNRDCARLTSDADWAAANDNVFVPVAFALLPPIAAAAAWLAARFGGVRMSGSGSALFIEIDDAVAATEQMTAAPASWRWRCVRSIANWFDNPSGQPRK